MKAKRISDEPVTVWGIHCAIDKESIFLDSNVIAIGWREMGDLSRIAPNREAYKKAFSVVFPNASKNSAANQMGQLYRFVCEAKIGDYVVFPSKLNRSINIGQIEVKGSISTIREGAALFSSCREQPCSLRLCARQNRRAESGTGAVARRHQQGKVIRLAAILGRKPLQIVVSRFAVYNLLISFFIFSLD